MFIYLHGIHDVLLTMSPAYLELADSEEKRKELYVEFVVDSDIINSQILAKRQFIGSEIFIRKLQEYYVLRNEKRKRGRPKKTEK